MATVQYPQFPQANVLLLTSNAVQTLLPSTLISQADALLLAHRLEDVADLAEQQRKKLQDAVSKDVPEPNAPTAGTRRAFDEIREVPIGSNKRNKMRWGQSASSAQDVSRSGPSEGTRSQKRRL